MWSISEYVIPCHLKKMYLCVSLRLPTTGQRGEEAFDAIQNALGEALQEGWTKLDVI
jgi:hypothetical protein